MAEKTTITEKTIGGTLSAAEFNELNSNFNTAVDDININDLKAAFTGKKVSIIGNSIETATDNNAVELTVLAGDVGGTVSAYVTKYDYDAGLTIGGYAVQLTDIGNLVEFTPAAGDVGKVIGKPLNSGSQTQSQKWWGIMSTKLGLTILQNVSWSGSRMSQRATTPADEYKASHAWHPSQITKCSKRDADGTVIKPDVIIINKFTNDFSHLPYALLTTFGVDATAIPVDDVVSGGYGFKEAIAVTVAKLREAYPAAEIVLCTMSVFKRITYNAFPTRNTVGTLPEYNNAIREMADYLGCGLIEFDKCGITFENIYPTYCDETTTPTHPNLVGQAKMAERAIRDLRKVFN